MICDEPIGLPWKTGFHFFPDHAPSASERGSAAESELLHHVVLTLGDRHRIVEPQRSERRRPDQTDTYRRADRVRIVVLQGAVGTLRGVDFAGRRPRRRSFIIPQ